MEFPDPVCNEEGIYQIKAKLWEILFLLTRPLKWDRLWNWADENDGANIAQAVAVRARFVGKDQADREYFGKPPKEAI